MPLSKQQEQKLTEWLKSKGSAGECPFCHQNTWQAGEIVSAPIYEAGQIHLGGKNIPTVQLICRNCLFVRLHAAVPIGLLESNEPEQQAKEEEQEEEDRRRRR